MHPHPLHAGLSAPAIMSESVRETSHQHGHCSVTTQIPSSKHTVKLCHLQQHRWIERLSYWLKFKSDRGGEISYGIPYMWNLKRNATDKLTKQREIHWLRERIYGCQRGREREFGMGMYTLLYLEWITNKDLLYSTWNSAQCYVPAWMGGEFEREWIHVHVWLSPFTVHLKLSQDW